MAQYRGTVQGSRGMASRLGTKGSGLRVEANGWNTGCTVELSHVDGKDVVRVWRTGGSNRGSVGTVHGELSKLIGEWEVNA